MTTTHRENLLVGNNRSAIFAAALAHVGKGSRVIDEGCPLTFIAGDMVEVGVARGHGRNASVRLVAVNARTLEAYNVV